MQWWSTYRFCSPEELDNWSDVVWWDAPDETGHMALVLHATRTVARLAGLHGASEACVRALVSQVRWKIQYPFQCQLFRFNAASAYGTACLIDPFLKQL